MSLKKTIAFLMAVLILSLSACSESPVEDVTENGSGDAVPTVAAEAIDQTDEKQDRASVPDNLPAIDFGGRDYRGSLGHIRLRLGTQTLYHDCTDIACHRG